MPASIYIPNSRSFTKQMSRFNAIASALAVAYALAYITHSEWGISRVAVRHDAMAVAALIAASLVARAIFRRKQT